VQLFQIVFYTFVISSIYIVVSLGLNLVFGVMNILNVAHGDLFVVAAYFVFWLFFLYGVDPVLSMLLFIPVFFLLGMALYWGVVDRIVRRARSAGDLTLRSLLLFFGLSILIESLVLVVWKGDYRSYSYLSTPLNLFGINVTQLQLVTLLISLGAVVFVQLFLSRSREGQAIQAVAQDRQAAMLMGINVGRISAYVLGIATALACVAGGIISMTYTIYPVVGVGWTMRALSVIVLGGLGNNKGLVLGAFVVGTSETLTLYSPFASWVGLVAYALLIAILILRPSGLVKR
jgi:branched-chain amino acid transport system permease protein